MTNIKPKRNQVTCTCEAYKFPHRLDSKACRELYNQQAAEPMQCDNLQSLGLMGMFSPDNSQPIRF